jgi:hypothetical protein
MREAFAGDNYNPASTQPYLTQNQFGYHPMHAQSASNHAVSRSHLGVVEQPLHARQQVLRPPEQDRLPACTSRRPQSQDGPAPLAASTSGCALTWYHWRQVLNPAMPC